MKNFKKYFYLTLGIFSVVLGSIGAFLPVFPTVPFLLLSLFCFSKSSDRAYQFLIKNKYFGKTLKDYYDGQGVSLAVKIKAVIFLSIGIIFSIYKMQNLHLRIFLAVVWLGVSVHIFSIKNKR